MGGRGGGSARGKAGGGAKGSTWAKMAGDYEGPTSYSDVPKLQGSEKQVAWAEKIRKDMIAKYASAAQSMIYADDGTIYPEFKNSLDVPAFTALRAAYSKSAVSRAEKLTRADAKSMGSKSSEYMKEQTDTMRTSIENFKKIGNRFKKETSAKYYIDHRYVTYEPYTFKAR